MVKWADQITKTSAVNAHLFKPSDYVRYAEIVAPLEENRDNHFAKCTGIALDQKSIFGRGLRMIDEEMVKIETIVVETIRALQQSIRGDYSGELLDAISPLSPGSSRKVAWETTLTIQESKKAKHLVVAASIMSYIQVNCEALRKLGKKIDKCLLLTGGALSLGEVTLQSNENGDNFSELTVEQKVVNSLDIRFGPIIEELKDIDLLLGGRLPENFNDSQASQLQEVVYKLTGRRDFFLSIPYSDTYMENKEQEEDQEDQLKPKPSLPNLVSSKYLWATALGMFCLIVGFQPIFADLCLKSKFNEATVVLFEAAFSALVGLVLAFMEDGKNGAWEVLSLSNVFFFSPTGALRAVEDTLSILVLRYVSPLMYIVITQLRLPLTALMAHLFLEKKPTLLEGQNIGLVVLGLLIFTLTDHSEKGSNDDKGNDLPIGLTLLFIAVICKVVASIWVDYALKKRSHLSIPIQSANISLATLIPATIFCFVLDAVDGKEVSTMLDGWQMITGVFVLFILCKNWMSNTIIKRFSSTTKYIVYAAATFVTFIFEIGLGMRNFTMPIFVSIVIVCYGVSLYAYSKSTLEFVVTKTIETIVDSGHSTVTSNKSATILTTLNSNKHQHKLRQDEEDLESNVQMISESN